MQQYWKNQTLINTPINDYTFASVPCGVFITETVIRIFLSSRNKTNNSFPFFLDLDMSSLDVINKSPDPLLELGKLGTFDDSGVMPTDVIRINNELWMYYIGWNLGTTVPFRNAIGLAVSSDNGLTFKKAFEGPILDRNHNEPYFCASCSVLKEDNIWKIWYLNCTEWALDKVTPIHKYHIKYAESLDGINWKRDGKVAIEFKYENEYAISVPRVFKENNIYKMWYSYRGGPYSEKYRIGYAESVDGIEWNRMDNLINIEKSQDGWDSDMQCYPFIFDYKNNRYMLYNGNEYGKTGIGLAVLER